MSFSNTISISPTEAEEPRWCRWYSD